MLSFKNFLENSQSKILIIMRGLPGSGKSSLAQKLGKGGSVFSTDDLFMSPEGKYQFDQSKLKINHELNLNRTKKAMENGISPVVVDNTNVSSDDIRPYVELAHKLGYKIEFREPETPWRYDASELAKRNAHHVPQDRIEGMLKNWEPNLTPDSFS